MKASAEKVVWTCRSPNSICFDGRVPGVPAGTRRATAALWPVARAVTTAGGTVARVTSPGPSWRPLPHAAAPRSIPIAVQAVRSRIAPG